MSELDVFAALLPAPGQDLSWQDSALCAQIGGDETWFPSKGGTTKPAKAMCARCEVSEQCREYAVEEFIREGIWGGTSPTDRRVIWKARRMLAPDDDEELTA